MISVRGVTRAAIVAVVCVFLVSAAAAAVDIQTVTVGNPGNAGELSGASVPGGYGPDRICGAVAYEYKIGKYEVTAGQYKEFLTAVAKTDTYGLYNTSMWSNTYGCKIQQSGSSGSYTYTVASDWANRPVNYVSWGDSAPVRQLAAQRPADDGRARPDHHRGRGVLPQRRDEQCPAFSRQPRGGLEVGCDQRG